MSSQAFSGSGSSAYAAVSRPGWLTFAAIVMFSVGFLRVISALYYFADSARVNNLTAGAFGDHLFLWGLWDIAIAGLAFWAGWSLLGGHTLGRVLGYVWAGVVIVQSFMILGYSPWFGFGALILAVLVIYALSTTSDFKDTSPAV